MQGELNDLDKGMLVVWDKLPDEVKEQLLLIATWEASKNKTEKAS